MSAETFANLWLVQGSIGKKKWGENKMNRENRLWESEPAQESNVWEVESVGAAQF